MEASALIWITVFAVAALLFFVTASVITVIGVRDLRDLLSNSARRRDEDHAPGQN